MKRYILLFFVMCMAAGFAVADDEGIGLTVGLEFGIGNINKANDGEISPYLMPMLIYENTFLDETLDVYAELDYTLGFTKEPNDDGKDVNPQSIYLDLMVDYNLSLGSASTLTFILENEFDEIIISPKFKDINALTGIFTPAVKFNHELDFGGLSAKIGIPITYVQYDKDADTALGLDITLGWNSNFGLGIETIFYTSLVPVDDSGYTGVEAIVSYETEPVYFEIDVFIPKEISDEGASITPEFDYSFQNFTFYINCEFAGIGINGGKVIVSPALGVKYSF